MSTQNDKVYLLHSRIYGSDAKLLGVFTSLEKAVFQLLSLYGSRHNIYDEKTDKWTLDKSTEDSSYMDDLFIVEANANSIESRDEFDEYFVHNFLRSNKLHNNKYIIKTYNDKLRGWFDEDLDYDEKRRISEEEDDIEYDEYTMIHELNFNFESKFYDSWKLYMLNLHNVIKD